MKCEDLAARLTDFLEGELDDVTEAAALEHVAHCEQCELVLSRTCDVIDLAGSFGRPILDPTSRSRMLGRLRDSPKIRSDESAE